MIHNMINIILFELSHSNVDMDKHYLVSADEVFKKLINLPTIRRL
ncbi:MAG: hypothetical protein CMIDDMOC_00470 [Sodalis sp. Fle]|nr:MAG: hypothetical protein CMIDDMOC_00470 [Sodalis sp. Fle]